jgi:hypothetical protein
MIILLLDTLLPIFMSTVLLVLYISIIMGMAKAQQFKLITRMTTLLITSNVALILNSFAYY